MMYLLFVLFAFQLFQRVAIKQQVVLYSGKAAIEILLSYSSCNAKNVFTQFNSITVKSYYAIQPLCHPNCKQIPM